MYTSINAILTPHLNTSAMSRPNSFKAKTAPTDTLELPIYSPNLAPASPRSSNKSPPTDTLFAPIELNLRKQTSISDISLISQKSNKPRPTDTFKLPFPKGFYSQEFPIKLPSIYPTLVENNLSYTAANCTFNEFANQNPIGRSPYTLKTRSAKIAIIVTMYNEDVDLFALTMEAVYKNIEYLIEKGIKNPDLSVQQSYEKLNTVENTHSPIQWSDIVVIIVCDGRQKCPMNVF